MFRSFCFFALVIIFVISCKKEKEADCTMLSQNPNWTTVPFKSNYSIQFPADYGGQGMVGFEGNIFSKIKNDSSVIFKYQYCSPLFCRDFGDTLSAAIPPIITVKNNDGTITTLDKTARFCDNSESLKGIFYYRDGAYVSGRLYWKDRGLHKEALDVNFQQSRLQEVLDIIQTIREK